MMKQHDPADLEDLSIGTPSPPPIVLHIKEFGGWNIGPDIRKCTQCGVRLWIASDGRWTDSRKAWEAPPSGYVNCELNRSAGRDCNPETAKPAMVAGSRRGG